MWTSEDQSRSDKINISKTEFWKNSFYVPEEYIT